MIFRALSEFLQTMMTVGFLGVSMKITPYILKFNQFRELAIPGSFNLSPVFPQFRLYIGKLYLAVNFLLRFSGDPFLTLENPVFIYL